MKKTVKKTNWQIKKFGEVLIYEQPTKYIVSSTKYKDEYETPVLTAGKSFILGKTREKDGIFPKNDLPVIIFDDFTTATKFVDFPFKVKSSAMKILHPVKNVSDAKFLFYIMQNINFDYTGIHKRYWISEYSNFQIPLPPLPEQKRIVKILDGIFEDVKKAKENAKKNLANAKELFDSYSSNIYLELLKKYKFEILNNLAELVRGPFGGSLTKSMFVKNGYAVYEQRNAIGDFTDNFRYFIDKKKFEEMKRFSVKEGDMIMSCSGTIGRFTIIKENKIEGIINQALLKISPNFKKIQKEYLLFILKNFIQGGGRHAKGAAIKNIVAVKELKKIQIPLPSLSEQKQIVKKLDELSAQTKKLEAVYQQKIDDLEELKKSVLKKAFSGKL